MPCRVKWHEFLLLLQKPMWAMWAIYKGNWHLFRVRKGEFWFLSKKKYMTTAYPSHHMIAFIFLQSTLLHGSHGPHGLDCLRSLDSLDGLRWSAPAKKSLSNQSPRLASPPVSPVSPHLENISPWAQEQGTNLLTLSLTLARFFILGHRLAN